MVKRKGCKPSRYLIFVWGDVEPSLKGPFVTNGERNRKAKELRRKEGKEHGIFTLDINKNCKPSVGGYSGAFFND